MDTAQNHSHVRPTVSMHTKFETSSPQSKPAMFTFPSLLHPSKNPTVLADRHNSTTAPAQTDQKRVHQYAHQVDHHQIATFLISFLTQTFTPVAYQQCTSSTPCWATPRSQTCVSINDAKTLIIVDDEFVLLEDSEEQDGGPLCREATIESWKTPKKVHKRLNVAKRWIDLPRFGRS